MDSADTIYAVSSGRPPAAIAVLRVSGPSAAAAAVTLAGIVPEPRRATLRALRDAKGDLLDRALLLWFPGTSSATGEDLLEIHAHGGRAVVDAIGRALDEVTHTRRAEPGEFTRRALLNGRIDLAQAEGLADLLSAETEVQRRQAILASEGALSGLIADWMKRLSDAAAMVEVAIDYEDEDSLRDPLPFALPLIEALRSEMLDVLARPPVERLRDGIRIVLAGPRNAGKSSLFNAMLERQAAITSPIAGTTRDVIEASIVRRGIAMILVDTAGLTERTDDPIEAIGINRATESIARADMVLWLGDSAPPTHDCVVVIHPQADRPDRSVTPPGALRVSVRDASSVADLWNRIEALGASFVPSDQILFNRTQRESIASASMALEGIDPSDPLIAAEHLRMASGALAAILGVSATETILDSLFGRFCLGK